MEPELGRDASVAIVLIAAIVALATNSIALGALVLAVAVVMIGLVALIQSRGASRGHDPRSH
jgi:hypothetical protein